MRGLGLGGSRGEAGLGARMVQKCLEGSRRVGLGGSGEASKGRGPESKKKGPKAQPGEGFRSSERSWRKF